MKKIIFSVLIAVSMTGVVSCSNSSAPSQTDANSLNSDILIDSSEIDSISTRGDMEVFGAESPTGTEVHSEGFGRCLESGCYCKEFKGRGQTCRNCGHAYKKHY